MVQVPKLFDKGEANSSAIVLVIWLHADGGRDGPKLFHPIGTCHFCPLENKRAERHKIDGTLYGKIVLAPYTADSGPKCHCVGRTSQAAVRL